MSNGGQSKALLESSEAAEYLGVGLATLYDYVASGLIDVVRLPKRSDDRKKSEPLNAPRRTKQFRRQDLDAFIERQIQEAVKPVAPEGTGGRVIGGRNQFKPGWHKSASR